MNPRYWRRSRFALLSLAVAACSDSVPSPTQPRSVPGTALASAGTGTNTAVTSMIADTDPTIAPAFQIRSDGGGAYKNSSSLISVIQSIGDWELDSYSVRNSTRMIYLDFSQPLPASGPNGTDAVAIPSGTYKVHMISKCHLYGNSYFSVAPGQTVSCPLHIGDIFVGSQKYALQMNPNLSAADTAWTETNSVNVTCNSTAGSCASWTVTPSGIAPDGSSSNVAALLAYYTTTSKGKSTTTIVKQGDFWMSFRIGLNKP